MSAYTRKEKSLSFAFNVGSFIVILYRCLGERCVAVFSSESVGSQCNPFKLIPGSRSRFSPSLQHASATPLKFRVERKETQEKRVCRCRDVNKTPTHACLRYLQSHLIEKLLFVPTFRGNDVKSDAFFFFKFSLFWSSGIKKAATHACLRYLQSHLIEKLLFALTFRGNILKFTFLFIV